MIPLKDSSWARGLRSLSCLEWLSRNIVLTACISKWILIFWLQAVIVTHLGVRLVFLLLFTHSILKTASVTRSRFYVFQKCLVRLT